MNVIEQRISGKLREVRPLAKKINPHRLHAIVNEALGIEFSEPDPPQPFTYQCARGVNWNVRPESRKGTENKYWIMYKQHKLKSVKVYLAAVGSLTRAKMEEKAAEYYEVLYGSTS